MRTSRLLFSLLLVSTAAFAQTAASTQPWSVPFNEDTQAILQAAAQVPSDKYAMAVVLLDETQITLEKGGREVTRRRLVYRIDSPDAVSGWAHVGARWAPWHQQQPEIRARVITREGAVHWLDPKTLVDAPAREDTPEIYSDDRMYGGPLPALAAGAIAEEETIVRDNAPEFEHGVVRRYRVGGGSAPTQETRMTIELPASLPFRHTAHLLPQLQVKKEELGERVRYTFWQGRMPVGKRIPPMLPFEEPQIPLVEFSTGESWAAVAAGYAAMSEPRIVQADVAKMIADARKGAKAEQMLPRLLARLHKDVRYTGVEFGIARLIPQQPAETLQRKYGDCKDKAAVMIAMLRSAGVPAYMALLNTGPGFDVSDTHPGIGLFDHAIVYVPGPPALWIDATAEFHRAGTLPTFIQGRKALVIQPGTTGLLRIPEVKPEDNLVRETREFYLAEHGPARIVETTEPRGTYEAGYRSSFSGTATKEERTNIEDYAKNMYLAEGIEKYDRGDASDLDKPFQLRIEVKRARRGSTDLSEAIMAIRVENIFERLPSWFRSTDKELKEMEDEEEAEEGGEEKSEPEPEPKPDEPARTSDFVFEPSITEWSYRVVPPAGFRLRSVPESKTANLGPAAFTRKFEETPSGEVRAVLRFDTVKGRYTAAEANALRTAVLELRKSDAQFITFAHKGFALVKEGKVREGLDVYETVKAAQPKEAMQRLRLANVLLEIGLAERAREEAREGVRLAPDSWVAHATLAWILQHDLIGRRFEKGFDLEGAVAAYRKAKELAPKEKDVRGNLAILLEHDAEGRRYTAKAKLDEAIAEYRAMKEVDEDFEAQYLDNLLPALLYAGRFEELKAKAAEIPSTPSRTAQLLAATAAVDGVPAAIELSRRRTSGGREQSNALVNAAQLLAYVRRYQQAADMFDAGAQASGNSAEVSQRAGVFRRAKRLEDIRFPASDPRSAVQRLFERSILSGDLKEIVGVLSKQIRPTDEREQSLEMRQVRAAFGSVRRMAGPSGMPLPTLADIIAGNMSYTVDGDDAGGYRIRLTVPGTPPSTTYVIKEDNEYRILGVDANVRGIGREVLARLERGDLESARRWLDWAREHMQRGGGDDVFSGNPFPHLWTKGDPADPAAIRVAAAALAIGARKDPQLLTLLDEALAATSDSKRKVHLHWARALWAQHHYDWQRLRESAEIMLASDPQSEATLRLAGRAYGMLRSWEPWQSAIEKRSARDSNDRTAIEARAELEAYRGDMAAARKTLKALIDQGRAPASILNSYAWYALYLDTVDDESLEIARRGNQETRNNSYAIMHTLACLYAEVGRTAEARELLLKTIAAGGLDEPDSEVWYGLGRVAEQYGDEKAALAAYQRVTLEEGTPEAISTYALAQKRLRVLAEAVKRPVKAASN
jgi:tetratricopeptide (TPR) repeat protein/transglutaminase-like putative cysteine protease